jgi:hypothetical protein
MGIFIVCKTLYSETIIGCGGGGGGGGFGGEKLLL